MIKRITCVWRTKVGLTNSFDSPLLNAEIVLTDFKICLEFYTEPGTLTKSLVNTVAISMKLWVN